MARNTSLRDLSGGGRTRPRKGGPASPAGRLPLVATALWLLTTAAHAQSGQAGIPGQLGLPGQVNLPAPTLPGQIGEGETEQTETPSHAPRSWFYALGVDEAYESDVRFDGTGKGDWHSRLQAGIGRQWTLPRGSFALSGNLSQLLYQGSSGQNRLLYDVATGVSYEVTRRLHWTASETVASSYSEDSSVLATAGLVFPRVTTRTNVASTALSYELTPRMTFDTSVSQMSVYFPGSNFSDGSSLGVKASISRHITQRQNIGISLGNTFSSGTTGDIQGLLGTWQYSVGPGLTVNASAGIRPYTLFGVDGYQFAPGGSVGVSTTLSRNQTFAATYEHAVEQAYGFNRTHLAHRLNANYVVTIGRRLSLEGNGNYGLNTYPQIANYTLDGRTATAGVRYLLWRQLSLGAFYGLWVRKETGVPASSTYRTTFSLSYGG
jgi:hypothetical protein